MAGPWHHTFLTDLADVQALHDNGKDLTRTCPNTGGQVVENRRSRRLHKADREKLRRDKLNEQFSELASALDPDRPKNDKATILGESIQVVKDLREDVKRLKTEHASLLEESADLTKEKNELKEEKASLINETERLQSQVQQRVCTSSPWMPLDPSLMMGTGATYPYPLPVAHPVTVSQQDSNQIGVPCAPFVTPRQPYSIPMVPPFHMHTTLQPYPMFNSQAGDGGNSYIPYSVFPPPLPRCHIERPYAQFPSSVQHPVPGYAVHMSPSQSTQPSPSSGSTVFKPCVPGIAAVPAQGSASSPPSKGSNDCLPSSQNCSGHGAEVVQDNVAWIPVEGSPSPSGEETAAAQQSKLKDPEVEACKDNALRKPSCIKEQLGYLVEKRSLSLLTEGQVRDIVHDLEMTHDPTLRPPAA